MSHGKLRNDKNCLNCGHEVTEKFCSNCGQENTETRQPFYFLITHFIEDFTHYDGQFWGTLKNLFVNPGKLTQIYLEGKRQRFVPPVKLYIFVSFITFFLFALFPPLKFNYDTIEFDNTNTKEQNVLKTEILKEVISDISTDDKTPKNEVLIAEVDSLKTFLEENKEDVEIANTWQDLVNLNNPISKQSDFLGYTSLAAYEKGNNKNASTVGWLQDAFAKKFFELKDKGVKKSDILRNLFQTSLHNLPKALFIYLPFFAFLLWIFHSKKKWWYFDHGVFTLHYFCFLLLITLATVLLTMLDSLVINIPILVSVIDFLNILFLLYCVVYFFIAHKRVYQSTKVKSFFIGCLLMVINFISFSFLLVGLGIFSFIMMQ